MGGLNLVKGNKASNIKVQNEFMLAGNNIPLMPHILHDLDTLHYVQK